MSSNIKHTSVLDVGSTSEINSRKTMEDQHVVIDKFADSPHVGFFAVYDGHCSIDAASYAAKRFHEILSEYLKPLLKNTFSVEPIKEIFVETYKKIDDEMKEKIPPTSGCCAVTSLVIGNDNERWVITANAGDSRAVLVNSNETIRLTVDHKPDIPSEEQRINDVNGFVFNGRVASTLAVSRSLGDHYMKEFICSTPYISAVEYKTPQTYLIIACDGIWDVIADDEIYPMLSNNLQNNATNLSRLIVNEAKKRGSTDNLSAIVVKLL